MDEARRVLHRLSRIERLEQKSVPAQVLLGEVRALLAEAEEWVRVEARGEPGAEGAIRGLRAALEGGEETVLAAERTLVA